MVGFGLFKSRKVYWQLMHDVGTSGCLLPQPMQDVYHILVDALATPGTKYVKMNYSVKQTRIEGLFIKNDLHIPKRFLGAFKVGHRPSAKEFIDEELSRILLKRVLESNYTDTEATAALDYLTRFNNEFHKNVIKKSDQERLHKTEKQVRDLYSRENSKNRDVMSVRKGSLERLADCLEPIIFIK